MSFARHAIEDALWSFAREAAPELDWIFANREGDRPRIPYGTLLVASSVALGLGEVELEESGIQVIERLRETFELRVSVQAFGDKTVPAMDGVAKLVTHAKRPSVSIGSPDLVWLGFLGASETRDVAAVVSGGWEQRAQADLRFSARFDCELTLDTIASVAISGAERTLLVEVPPA